MESGKVENLVRHRLRPTSFPTAWAAVDTLGVATRGLGEAHSASTLSSSDSRLENWKIGNCQVSLDRNEFLPAITLDCHTLGVSNHPIGISLLTSIFVHDQFSECLT